ncbi:MAG: glycoside hydrolase [Gemmatimonadetes bacterium]|nr:glycoside hydrolase [Gemmatimonadota bacterium]
MTSIRRVLLLSLFLPSFATAQQFDLSGYAEMRWRNIGPHRASRTKAASGVSSQPNVFYMGAVNGGVWKTADYGRTWVPIFDDQPTGSIGAIAVAPSDPNVVYVGSGEGLQRPDLSTGDGMYKSTDAGKTWTHLGLRDGQQIPEIIVDPTDPSRLFVAVLGHPYGPNQERGVFRSTDGGQSFQKVLYRDENTGASDLLFDPKDPNIVYAVLWESRQGPWENGAWNGPGSGLFKSVDGGNTWRQLTRGLPGTQQGLGRIGIGIAPSDGNRLYAIVEARGSEGGIYRSDDAGESWTKTNADGRVANRPTDASEIIVDPRNPDVAYSITIVSWKTTDGGRTWTGWKGAPGGDDYQKGWINPNNPDIIFLTSDQGAVVTVNGGQTWSSWYNQPTAQFYHVTADNAFPYRLCSGQQESGSSCVSSRGDDGQLTFREWHPVAASEYSYVAPDPLNPDMVYGGTVSRYDRRTGQVQNVSPRPLRSGTDYRTLRTAPILFSPVDPHALYFATNHLWKTLDGGNSWARISPDLTRTDSVVPANVGVYSHTPTARARHPGVIYTVAPSYTSVNTIWVGSDDGLIHVTHDGGKTWKNVTPRELMPWAKVSIMDAGHSDTLTAYAAINTLRLDDLKPHIYRTHDGGKTWTHITNGIPDGGVVNVVREDPRRKGLLFAGTEQTVYVSFDDGDRWQSLRLNLPATSIRDLIIKDDDIAVGTHGRSFWILDDITPLRQLADSVTSSRAFLFRPQLATRFRWNKNTDTPLPPEEPAGQNPPDGAIINYHLASAASGPVTLEITDSAGNTVRKFSSEDRVDPPVEGRNIPDYWIRPAQTLAVTAGMHRFVWDLHYPPPAVLQFTYPIAAIYRNTPRTPFGPWVSPGRYTVKLTVDGQAYTQPLTVRMDPRVKTPAAVLARQFTLSKLIYDDLRKDYDALRELRAMRQQLAQLKTSAGSGPVADSVAALDQKAAGLEGSRGGGFGGGGRGGAGSEQTLTQSNGSLASVLGLLQGADVAPTTQALAAVTQVRREVGAVLARWDEMKTRDLTQLNVQLRQANLPLVDPASWKQARIDMGDEATMADEEEEP